MRVWAGSRARLGRPGSFEIERDSIEFGGSRLMPCICSIALRTLEIQSSEWPASERSGIGHF